MKQRAPQRRGEISRQKIRDAAAIEFGSKGYEGASLRAIARACDVELRLVQYHFGDKLALWSAVLDEVLGTHSTELRAAMARVGDRRPSDQVAVFIEMTIRRAAVDPVFAAIILHARTLRGPESIAVHERVIDDALGVVKLIVAAQADGEFIAGDPGLLFHLMIGAAVHIYMTPVDAEAIIGRSPGDPALVDDHVRTMLLAFMPGRAEGDAISPPSPSQSAETEGHSTGRLSASRPYLRRRR